MNATTTTWERFCLDCHHSLRGLNSRKCPECGRSFDPDDLKTTAATQRIQWIEAVTKMTEGCIIVLSIVAVITFIIQTNMIFAGGFGDPILIMLGCFPTLPILLFIFVASCIPKLPLNKVYRTLGLLLPIFCVSLVLTNWPIRVMFAIHKSRLDAIATSTIKNGVASATDRVGLMKFRQVTLMGGNVGFQTSGNSGGGTYIVKAGPNAGLIWSNTNWEVDLGDDWYLVYED